MIDFPTSGLDKTEDEFTRKYKVNLYIKRDDLIHPEISGNKWRKLKYNLENAKAAGKKKLLTFGGAFSNHIYATAAAGKEFGFATLGIIRGERTEPLNATLSFAETCGMRLIFVSRSAFKLPFSKEFLTEVVTDFMDYFIIPEGGKNLAGAKGCSEIPEEIPLEKHILCSAVGTGTTLAGMICSGKPDVQIVGIPVLKDYGLENEIREMVRKINPEADKNWSLNYDFHFGGYAKFTSELLDFMCWYYSKHFIYLDPVYTGKMMFAVYDLMKKGVFQENSNVVCLHTGGLQGITGFVGRYGPVIPQP
jgi:1-aminocyclopropane-1-carboxylate deaminase